MVPGRRIAEWLRADDVPRRRDLTWLALLGALVLGAGLGLRDPWPPDEPRFALAARDMVETGRWLFPRVGGVLYPDKPPLFMWLQAVIYSASGSLRLSFLLPSALASVGTLLLTYELGRRLWDRRTGLAAALVLLCMLQFQIQAKSAQIDATLAFMTTLSLYGLLRHLLCGPDWRWFWIGCGSAGLGVITKGVGFLPLLALAPWGWAAWRGWTVPRPAGAWRWWAGAGAFVAVIALWLVPMVAGVVFSGDPEFAAYRDNILFKQTAQRYADAWGHFAPPWYLLVNVIPWAWLPVTALLPWLLPRWAAALRERDARILVLAGWVLLVVAFFSASTGKRGVYILPAVPAVALLAAPWARDLVGRTGARRMLFAVLVAFVVALAAISLRPPGAVRRVLEETGAGMPWGFMGSMLAAGILAVLVFRVRRAAAGFLALTIAGWSIVGWLGYPMVTDLRSGRPVMEAFSQRLPPGAEPGLIAWKEQFLLHLDRPVTHFGYRRPFEDSVADGIAWLAADPKRLALIGDEHGECFDASRAIHLGYAHRNHWYLVGYDAVDPACGDGRERPELAVEYVPTRRAD
jgi:4-amino-4-deoxy-L-arabinose transferase-like glycosyltransferase